MAAQHIVYWQQRAWLLLLLCLIGGAIERMQCPPLHLRQLPSHPLTGISGAADFQGAGSDGGKWSACTHLQVYGELGGAGWGFRRSC